MALAPALFSVALMDETCPPSSVYAACNRYAGPEEMVVYPYSDHEGGEALQRERQAAWLAEVLSAPAPVRSGAPATGGGDVRNRP